MGENQKGRAAAMITVEASFIVPIFILLLAMLVSLSFAEYDRCAALQECAVRVQRESVRKSKDGPGEGSGRGWVTYIGLGGMEYTAQTGSHAEAGARGTVNTPVSFAGWMEAGNPFSFSITVRARLKDPPQAFRRYRRSLAVLSAAADLVD